MDSSIAGAIAAPNKRMTVHLELWQKSVQIWLDQAREMGEVHHQLIEDLSRSELDPGTTLSALLRHGAAQSRVNIEATRKHMELARHTLIEIQETVRTILPAQARDVLAGPEQQITELIYETTEDAVEQVHELAGKVERVVEAELEGE